MRVGMLNVWEAKALGEGNLKEGHRYQVSQVFTSLIINGDSQRTVADSLNQPGRV